MLFHLSIEADDPRHVAEVLAELWGGEALPFPPVIEGSWMAMAGDDRGTMIEVYPRGTELIEGEDGALGRLNAYHDRVATHFAMATRYDLETVLAVAERENWPARQFMRGGGLFGVIEIWVEGRQMIEVLTPRMQRDYLKAMTPDAWRAMLAQPAAAPAAKVLEPA